MAFGVCTNCSSSFPPSTGQKWKIFAKYFFDIVTTYNDEICHVKHVLDPLCVFFTLFGCGGGGGTKGCRAHNLLMQFSGLGSSKMEFSEITSKRVVRSSAGAYAIYPPFWGSFGGHSRTIPQGMVPDVQPLVKSSF